MTTARLSDPIRLARYLLREFAPTASVRVRGTTEVAGRSAYRLIMNPRSDVTLIGSVSLAMDVETRLPLRVRVMPSGSHEAAIEAVFTGCRSIEWGAAYSSSGRRPARRSSTPSTISVPDTDGPGRSAERCDVPAGTCRSSARGSSPRWIVRLKNGAPSSLAQQMPYQGPLVSALLIDGPRRDWLLAGPVPLEVLEADADRLWSGSGLAARGLPKRCDPFIAVHPLDLAVEQGEKYGFIGTNGSSKTTTIRMVRGLISPTAGVRIEMFGEPLGPDRGALRRVGALVEEPAFWPYLSGRRNLEYFARAGRGARRHTIAPSTDRGSARHGRVGRRRRSEGEGIQPRHAAAPGYRAGSPRGSGAPGAGRADERARPDRDARGPVAGAWVGRRGTQRARLEPSAR